MDVPKKQLLADLAQTSPFLAHRFHSFALHLHPEKQLYSMKQRNGQGRFCLLHNPHH